MSKPTEQELAALRAEAPNAASQGDDEGFHVEFDQALEAKLRQPDPEWMKAMNDYYESTGLCRWYA